jgi:hypothetical protein
MPSWSFAVPQKLATSRHCMQKYLVLFMTSQTPLSGWRDSALTCTASWYCFLPSCALQRRASVLMRSWSCGEPPSSSTRIIISSSKQQCQ